MIHLGHQTAGDGLLWSFCSAKQTPLFFVEEHHIKPHRWICCWAMRNS